MSLRVFLQFLHRDWYVFRKKITDVFINYVILSPLYLGGVACIQAYVFRGADTHAATQLIAGSILLVLLQSSYKQTIELLFDFEGDRFIDYQMTVLSPRLIIIERVFFTSLFIWAITLPYFPLTKLWFGSLLDFSHTNWIGLIIVAYVSALCCAAYHMLAAILLPSSSDITTLWARVNIVLLNTGGFAVPLFLIKKYAPHFSYLLYANPLMYITEGFRQALLRSPQYMSLTASCLGLLSFTTVFMLLAMHFFKKRTDHI